MTLAGVGFTVALMLFLAGVYGGVETEANGYVAQRPVDAWIAQRNATNLIRSSSFLHRSRIATVSRIEGVESIAPMLRLITTLTAGGRDFTVFACGVDPQADETRPFVVSGTGTFRRGEIVVDRALARRAGLSVGDSIRMQDRSFRVSGISSGTNVIISQFTFISIAEAEELLGFRNVVSFLLVRAQRGVSASDLAARLRKSVTDVNVFTSDEFVANNLSEMQTGLLPILATVGFFGGVVGTTVVTLLLYSAILERRDEYAVLKAVGAGPEYVRRLVLRQALASIGFGFLLGCLLYTGITPIAASLVPVLATSLSVGWLIIVAAISISMGVLGAFLPIRRLERIYPAEVFRA